MGDKLKHYTVDSWHSVLFYVVPAVFFEDCSKHGAGERSTQDQTSCLLREQYIASTQVLCRKSFRVGTSEQYLYHISLQKRMKREEKGQLKLGFKKKKNKILPVLLYLALSFRVSGMEISPRNTEYCREKINLNGTLQLSTSLLQYQCLTFQCVTPL